MIHLTIANNLEITTNKNTIKVITLAAIDADNDPLTYTIVSQPAHGTITGNLEILILGISYKPGVNDT